MKFSMLNIANALAKTLDEETVAHILNGLLCCEDNDSLTDAEAAAGSLLFECLCEVAPNAVTIAHGL